MSALWLYMRYSRLLVFPIINFKALQFQTFKNNVVSGISLRMAFGTSPFILPLMLQPSFGLSPMESGLLTVATAVGALCTRAVLKYSIRKFVFRTLFMGATTLIAMAQQLTLSIGEFLGASMLTMVSWWYGEEGVQVQAQVSPPAFVAIGLLSPLSLLFLRKLQARDGDLF